MANWTILKTAIADVVRANGNQEITGPLLQGVLNSIVNAVGEHATFAGIAIPSTNPGVPDGPVFYLASKEGIYPNFGLTINFGESAVFKWQEDSWVKLTTGFATTASVDKHLPNSDLVSISDVRDNTYISSSGALSKTAQDAKVFVIDVSDYWTKEVYISTTKTTGTSLFYAFYNSVDLSSSSYMPEGVALAGNSFSNIVSIPPGAVKLAVANIDNTFVDFKVVLLGVGSVPYNSFVTFKQDVENKVSSAGYHVCSTAEDVMVKSVSVPGLTELTTNIRLLIKMASSNTTNGASFNINTLGAKPLYYNNAEVTADNRWKAGEVIEVYYDGEAFYALNAAGGGTSGGGNMILEWDTDVATTRKLVEQANRKPGVQISYQHPDDGWVNEQYVGVGTSDVSWESNVNWQKIPNQKEVDDLSSILVNSEAQPYEIGEADTNNVVFGITPRLSDQMPLRHIDRVWLSDAAISGVKMQIYAANYTLGKTSAGIIKYESVTITRVAELVPNEGGWYDTDLTLKSGEIYGFVCLATTAVGTAVKTKTSSDTSLNATINTVANANKAAVGENVAITLLAGSFWHKVASTKDVPTYKEMDGAIKASIVDNLITRDINKSLSANQGYQLFSSIDGSKFEVYSYEVLGGTRGSIFGYVPCPQVMVRMESIDRVWLDIDPSKYKNVRLVVGTYVQGGSKEYYEYTVNLTKIVDMTYSEAEACYLVPSTSVAEDEVYGFLFEPIGTTPEPYHYEDIINYKSLVVGSLANAQSAAVGSALRGNSQRYSLWYAVGNSGVRTEVNKLRDRLNTEAKVIFRDYLYPNFDIQNWTNEVHDCTIVNKQFWSFGKTNNGGWCKVSDLDGTYRSDLSFHHKFTQDFIPDEVLSGYAKDIEMKSVDYWDGKMVLGNGASAFNSEDTKQYSRLFIFYNADAWVGSQSTITFDNCGEYKAINLQALGNKCYGVWAGKDTMFVSINFFDDIYMIQLGKGTNDLSLVENGYGDYEAAATDRYNGTYRVVRHWTCPNPPLVEVGGFAGVKEGWHGGQFYNGHFYIAPNGPNKCCVYRVILGEDSTIKFDVLSLENYGAFRTYKNGGSGYLTHNYIDGICIDRETGKLYAQALEGEGGRMIIASI